ncbi:MAG TPA: hypothetical protein V6C97_02345 [Oculatellaceae cyanobacterium]
MVSHNIRRNMALIPTLFLINMSSNIPTFSRDMQRGEYLALRDARLTLLNEEADLRKDKQDIEDDIAELSAKLRGKHQKLDSIYGQLKDVDLSIKQIEKDLL